MRSLGARFLPVPADRNLEVEADQVLGFLREIALLRAPLGLIAFGTKHPRTAEEHREQIQLRLRIIEEAALRALGIGGGVLIR
ncbi:hypothetical protein ACIF80_14770 [Streptomyces sp. NPDC085927]|uniref:hypothetical protein n=1 Tax=Streptomyces sp. NPDC085927 TaxID=3365738 RepID=UPI0037D4752A